MIAFRKPASVFSAKYTTILAAGAIDPDTSISNITSPSGPFGSPVGLLLPLPTETADTVGVSVSFELTPVIAEVCRVVTAAQLDQRDTFSRPICAGGKVVERGDLYGV